MMMTNSFCRKHCLLRIALVLLISATAYRAPAQVVVPALRQPIAISTFANFSDVKPHFQYYDDRLGLGLFNRRDRTDAACRRRRVKRLNHEVGRA